MFSSGVIGAIPQLGSSKSTPAVSALRASAFTSAGDPKTNVFLDDTLPKIFTSPTRVLTAARSTPSSTLIPSKPVLAVSCMNSLFVRPQMWRTRIPCNLPAISVNAGFTNSRNISKLIISSDAKGSPIATMSEPALYCA